MIYVTSVFLIFIVNLIQNRYFDHRVRSGVLFSSLFLIALVSGLRRFDIGTDTAMYVAFYISPNQCIDNNVELGYCFLNSILGSSGQEYTLLLLIESLLLYLSLGIFIYKFIDERFWGIALLMLYGIRLIFISMNISRQYLAISIGVFAFIAFFRKQKFVGSIIAVLAMSVHFSAIIIFLFPMFKNISRYRKICLLLVISSFLFSFIDISGILNYISSFNIKYQGYAETTIFYRESQLSPFQLFYAFLCSVIIIVLLFVNRKIVLNNFLFSGALLYVMLSNFFCGMNVVSRISDFYLPFFIWAYCEVFKCMEIQKRILVLPFTTFICLLVCWIEISQYGHFDVYPYYSFLE